MEYNLSQKNDNQKKQYESIIEQNNKKYLKMKLLTYDFKIKQVNIKQVNIKVIYLERNVIKNEILCRRL